jgi:acyl-CoA synthetase (AMP-forming)/AMP-acid ligase II
LSTVPALVAGTADRFGDRLAVVDGDTRITYDELLEQSRTFGAALVASGVQPGDRVGIWAFNCAEWIVAVLGLLQAGSVLVPVNTRFKGLEATDILFRSGATVLVTVTDFLGTDYVSVLRESGTELPELRTIVMARGPAPPGTESWAAFLGRRWPRTGPR